MTNKEDFAIDFSGVTHDHTPLEEEGSRACSTIAILRRHPMYDCLVLVKKYRTCLNGYVLEFPESELNRVESGNQIKERDQNQDPKPDHSECSQRKLISRFLDGDDPIYSTPVSEVPKSANSPGLSRRPTSDYLAGLARTLGRQPDELVHVPINGLLDRLKGYTQSGISIDGRVYAFAMGLKTAERFLVTSAMRELQETPI